MLNKSGWCVWITGLPGSGKSLISHSLVHLLKGKNISNQLISSDSLRKAIVSDPIYSDEERDMVYRTLVFVAKILTQNRTNVIIDATGNLRRYRESARFEIKKFIEVYLKCPLNICIKRETTRKNTYKAPKLIYKRALEGLIPNVPGIGASYEPPYEPEIMLNTEVCKPCDCTEKIFKLILDRYY